MTWECLVWDLDGTLVAPGSTTPVPGVAAALAAHRAAGTLLAVATSAPTEPARALIARLGWDAVIDHVAGTAPGVLDKADVVAEALLALGRPLPEGASGTAVVGDSASDMAAAARLGLAAIGAAWTGASPARLREAGADVVVVDPAALPDGPASPA